MSGCYGTDTLPESVTLGRARTHRHPNVLDQMLDVLGRRLGNTGNGKGDDKIDQGATAPKEPGEMPSSQFAALSGAMAVEAINMKPLYQKI